MIDPKELVRPSVLLALAGSAAVGFAAGFLVGRDPQLLRRVLAAAAQGWEQARLSVAEAREAVADQWAEARDEAVDRVEQAAFAGSVAAAAAAPVPAAEPAHDGEHKPEAVPRPKRRAKAASGRRAPRAARTTH
jgi:hypothetical protein